MAIAYVKRLGQANKNTGSATTFALTTTGGASAAGSSILVAIVHRSGTAMVTGVTDAVGNVYTVDAQVANGANLTTAIASCHQAAVLANGSLVTVTFSAVQSIAAIVAEEVADPTTGLSSVGPDRTATGTGASTAPATAATATTAYAAELLYGAVGVLVDATGTAPTMTAGAGWTRTTEEVTASSSLRVGIYPEYRIVAATGAYVADGTLSASKTWAAVIATHREPASFQRRASQVVAEVAAVGGTTAAASFVGAEVALGVLRAGVSFVGAEVALRSPAPAAGRRRPPVQVIA